MLFFTEKCTHFLIKSPFLAENAILEKHKIFWKAFYAERIIWKNKVFRVDNRSVFYKLYYENGTVYVLDFIFESDNKQSYGLYRQKGLKTDFLTWTGLRLSVPKERTQVV